MRRMIPNFIRALLVAFFSMSLCAAANAQQTANSAASSVSERAFGQKLFLNGVPNFGGISPTLFRGAQPSQEGFNALAKMGVEIVINLRGDQKSEEEQVTKLGMQYISIPSQCSHMTDEGVAKFLSILRENPDKKIFVHCQFGVDRTGMMIAAYRIVEQGWTAEESRREMEAFGFSRSHRMICPGLASFESSFPNAFANDSAFENLRPLGDASGNSNQNE
jgi:tyrosine-protein phosphatase SIW14